MKKHIKVQAKLINNNQEVEITFIEQTHFMREFSEQGCGISSDSSFVAFHKVDTRTRLASHDDNKPHYTTGIVSREYTSRGCRDRFYLPRNIEDFRIKPVVTTEQWKHIKIAIEAYNEHFKD